MNQIQPEKSQTAFERISPDVVVSVVEKELGVLCSNLCRPLNSYINRVYELESVHGDGLIAKFYRPGRWSKEALADEHDFLIQLAEAEVPVVGPLKQITGSTLGEIENVHFAVFPKKSGRFVDEYSDDQWLELGRLLGRTHAVGATKKPQDRIVMSPDKVTRSQLRYLQGGDFIQPEQVNRFADVTGALLEEITPAFDNLEMIRIHGDCHFSNLIYRPDESFYIIDFDDMAVGPAVQDFWMLLPGYVSDSLVEIDLFLEGYETFRDFDRRTLRLIEPLRAMRYIHYMTWCAHQVAEDGLSQIVPDFGSQNYWLTEINDLIDQLDRIRKPCNLPGMM